MGDAVQTKNYFCALALTLCAVLLSACGGGAGSGRIGGSTGGVGGGTTGTTTGGTTGTVTAPTPANIALISSSPNLASGGSGSGAIAASVTLTATVTDSGNVTISGARVTLSASAGALSPTVDANGNVVTDANGNVTATLAAGNAAPGSVITVTAAAGSLTPVTVQVRVISTTPSFAMGTLSPSGTFTAGVIAVGQSPLAAGGSSGLQVSIVDTANGNTPINTAATVGFSSPCQSQSLAQIVSPVTSSTGTFATTYRAAGCSGNDTITASATVGGATVNATGTVNVQAAALGSIQFVSATPTTIALRGTGLQTTSTLVFRVVDQNGNPVQNQQVVNFSLTTMIGGLSVSPTSATTDANGNVQTTVQAGTVSTPVRVIASLSTPTGGRLTSQSSVLTVSTGFPTQNGFSLSASRLNIEGNDIDGTPTTITARLSDRYNNPVPDGTAVSFTTECGQIQPQCTTGGGTCSVTFTSQNPRTSSLAALGTPAYNDNNCGTSGSNALGCNDHRCTVLAYAIGEESFNDCNGTGLYVSRLNPANNSSQCPSGDFFVSLPEAFLDSNENGVRNGNSETFIDFNRNGGFDSATGNFVGLLCDPANQNCDSSTSLNVRGSLVIVMSSSTPIITPRPSPLKVPLNGSATITVGVTDNAGQIMPVGTTVSVATSYGTLAGPSSFTVANSSICPVAVANCSNSPFAGNLLPYGFTVQGSSTAGSGVLTITVTTPGGLATIQQVPVSN